MTFGRLSVPGMLLTKHVNRSHVSVINVQTAARESYHLILTVQMIQIVNQQVVNQKMDFTPLTAMANARHFCRIMHPAAVTQHVNRSHVSVVNVQTAARESYHLILIVQMIQIVNQ